MKFILIVQKTALLIAVENNNAEIVKLLLKRPEINVNCLNAITGIYGIKRVCNLIFNYINEINT